MDRSAVSRQRSVTPYRIHNVGITIRESERRPLDSEPNVITMVDDHTFQSAGEELTAVELPTRLVSRVESRLPPTRFDTPDEYIACVLEETLARLEAGEDAERPEESVDEAEVRERLEYLGYLS